MEKSQTDKALIRIKDIVLIVATLSSGIAFATKIYSQPEQLQILKDKYVPMIEKHEIQLAIINAQYAEIIRRLDRIEKK